MKKAFIWFVFLFSFSSVLFAGFMHQEQGRFNFYYDNSLNRFSLEYIIKQIKKFDIDYKEKFPSTNNAALNIYLYNDTIKFIDEQKGMWWQNYIIKPNLIGINNIDLLLAKNSLQDLLEYVIYRINFLNSFENCLPAWFINGLAIYYTDKNMFKTKGLKFASFDEFVHKLDSYTTLEEFEEANYCCYKGVKYLMDNYGEGKVLEHIKTVNNKQEFKNKFINVFNVTYDDFIRMSLNL